MSEQNQQVVELSIGQEIMRTQFTSNKEVLEWKQKYARLFDEIVDLVNNMQIKMDTPPTIHSPETIARHMDLIKRGEDAIRCFAEASKILETSCMYLVKGLTA